MSELNLINFFIKEANIPNFLFYILSNKVIQIKYKGIFCWGKNTYNLRKRSNKSGSSGNTCTN